jgi:hypothetical protein
MKMQAADATISERIGSPFQTSDEASPTLTMAADIRLKNQAAWQAVYDDTLMEWGLDVSRFVEAGLTPPSAKAISVACQVAKMLRDGGAEAPLRVVPNGDGGLVFERSKGEVFETLEIQEGGAVEWASFRNSRLHARTPWPV